MKKKTVVYGLICLVEQCKWEISGTVLVPVSHPLFGYSTKQPIPINPTRMRWATQKPTENFFCLPLEDLLPRANVSGTFRHYYGQPMWAYSFYEEIAADFGEFDDYGDPSIDAAMMQNETVRLAKRLQNLVGIHFTETGPIMPKNLYATFEPYIYGDAK